MIRLLTLSIVFLYFSASLLAQQSPPVGIQKAAEEFAQANMEEDYETLIEYTYPWCSKNPEERKG
ncbi:hypothetical protein [Echinicola strongylocentroti]|uniref:hypothetical protein n=1 Tax=Echinicola strongylocentroti TaxID=1795355 RepID=UPI0013A6E1F3|nr:hypothetical protein [Echinicola strongylocentroti]